jgi:adenosylhomocysteine nucleosidase
MTIALIGALATEVAPIVRATHARKLSNARLGKIYQAHIGAHDTLIAEVGIGKVRAAAILQSLIDHHSIEAVICFGSAGAINPQHNVGDLIVAQRVTQHDYQLVKKLRSLGAGHEWIKTDARLSKQLVQAGVRAGFAAHIKLGNIITGDVVVANGAMRHQLWQKFRADAVEMEGAAIGLVCNLNRIPFAVIRGLTDKADEQETHSFRKHIKPVAANVAQVVVECVREL